MKLVSAFTDIETASVVLECIQFFYAINYMVKAQRKYF